RAPYSAGSLSRPFPIDQSRCASIRALWPPLSRTGRGAGAKRGMRRGSYKISVAFTAICFAAILAWWRIVDRALPSFVLYFARLTRHAVRTPKTDEISPAALAHWGIVIIIVAGHL